MLRSLDHNASSLKAPNGFNDRLNDESDWETNQWFLPRRGEESIINFYQFRSVLNIKNASHDGIYRCEAFNSHGSKHADRYFITNSDSEEIHLRVNATEYIVGDDLLFLCEASPLNYSKLDWYQSKCVINCLTLPHKLPNTSQVMIHNLNNQGENLVSTLTTMKIDKYSAGTYYCNATLKVDAKSESSTKDTNSSLNSNMYKTLVKFAQSSMFELFYGAIGKPKPTIEWSKDEQVIEQNDRLNIHTVDDSSHLVIQNLNISDKGKYECRISNKGGTIRLQIFLEVVGSLINALKVVIILFVITVLSFVNQFIHPDFPADRLKIKRTLGEGAFGRVVLAQAIGLSETGKTTYNTHTHDRNLNIVNCLGAVTKCHEHGNEK
uniref:Ig-like domain-containing protein n=1 Tax=Tetranychus urticae TaxID=32264 RepID=T1KLX9_TETUR